MKKLNMVFITGAGISRSSGLPIYTSGKEASAQTTIAGLGSDDCPITVFECLNARLLQVQQATPSDAHYLIAELQNYYNVQVITQNIDDLHERAGVQSVIHVHGRVGKYRTAAHCCHIGGNEVVMAAGKKCEHGSHWRHDVVLYGEPLHFFEEARRSLSLADILIVVGCSMLTNTGRNLVKLVGEYCPVYFINPYPHIVPDGVNVIQQPAYSGIWTALNDICSAEKVVL